MSNTLRDHFMLDPNIHFLNHGSYGACPGPVFDSYQRWQRELERQPVEFLGRRSDDLLAAARAELGAYINADPNDFVFVTNATSGLNVIARSLPLELGDEILTTDHEYGALKLTWEWMCGKAGARYVPCPIPLPVTSAEEIVESIWAAVTPRTRVLFLSHLTSPTALIFPVKELCRRAREAGILSIVDGAHVPGHLPLDLTGIGADIYAGNCHKWLCAPKGAAFLYVRPEHHDWIEAQTISWGWQGDSTFVTRNTWQGTRDLAAFLAVPDAIAFQRQHNWDEIRANCHELASTARQQISDLTGLAPISPDSPEWFGQMVACPVPAADAKELHARIYNECRVEVQTIEWSGRVFVRASFQGYNDDGDLDALMGALRTVLPLA